VEQLTAPPQTSPDRWGVGTEHEKLTDVLLCKPRHFEWLPTSAISRATLDSGARFDGVVAEEQHLELVDALEGAGVRCHYLEADPALPYQVFTRDSSLMTPRGAVITQLHQPWRRGEYAAVSQFYTERDIPIWRRVTAGPLEGGDFMFIDGARVLIGASEERTTWQAAEQLSGWLAEEGIEVRIESIPARYVHMDVLCCMLAPGLAAVCTEAVSVGLHRWLRSADIEVIDVPSTDAMRLGVNVLSLGGDRVVSGASARELNATLRAHGLGVLDPELDSFTLGGGGAHCLTQPLRRESLSGGS
jgi:arginine deiminase